MEGVAEVAGYKSPEKGPGILFFFYQREVFMCSPVGLVSDESFLLKDKGSQVIIFLISAKSYAKIYSFCHL